MQTGVFFGMRAAGRIMIRSRARGIVINISSIRGFSPNPGRHGLLRGEGGGDHDDQDRRRRVGRQGIRVNAIAPGVLRTPMWDADVARGAIDEPFYLDLVPAKRLGTPADVGKLAVYLCSDARRVRQRLDDHDRRGADLDPGGLMRSLRSPPPTRCGSRDSTAGWPRSPVRAAASASGWPRRSRRSARASPGSTSLPPSSRSPSRSPPTSATRPRWMGRSRASSALSARSSCS